MIRIGEDIYNQLSWFDQEHVAQARVMVVGCGALGNEVMKNLILFGVEHLTIVDFDKIEVSNLSRSILFSREDAQAHRLKVDVAKQKLQAINPQAEITTIVGDIAYDVGLQVIARMDVVIGCVDSRWARYCINRLCMRAGVPWVDGGINGLEGTARVFQPGENCYACNLGTEGLRELQKRMPCSATIHRNEVEGKAPTTPIVASIIGAVQVQEALKLIHQEQLEQGELTSLCGRIFYYEGQHLSSRIAYLKAWDDDCAVHERWSPVLHLELSNEMTVAQLLQILHHRYPNQSISIDLHDVFVDVLENKATGEEYEVMLPKHLVEDWIGYHPKLQHLPDSIFYLHEYRQIDDTFPYPQLKLSELGFPELDILCMHTDNGVHYIQ